MASRAAQRRMKPTDASMNGAKETKARRISKDAPQEPQEAPGAPQEASAEEGPPSRFIVVEDLGNRQYRISPQGYADPEVIPTILRRAAIEAEKAMGARE